MKCHKSFEGERVFVSALRSGITCSRCQTPGLRAMPAASLTLAQTMLEKKLDQLSADGNGTARPVGEYLLDVIEHHIEKKLKTRQMMETA
jgi:hypothetical protein